MQCKHDSRQVRRKHGRANSNISLLNYIYGSCPRYPHLIWFDCKIGQYLAQNNWLYNCTKFFVVSAYSWENIYPPLAFVPVRSDHWKMNWIATNSICCWFCFIRQASFVRAQGSNVSGLLICKFHGYSQIRKWLYLGIPSAICTSSLRSMSSSSSCSKFATSSLSISGSKWVAASF